MSALYPKNVPVAERTLRVVLGAAMLIAAFYAYRQHWLGVAWPIVIVLAAATLVLTGFFGFCPMCYVGGRRVLNR